MANLTAFRASAQSGFSRSNQFQVNLSFPSIVSGGTAAAALGQFHCRAASLPSSTVAPIKAYYQGRAIHVAGEREFQPWQVTVYNEDFMLRDTLERWSNAINNISNNSGVIQPAAYTTDLTLNHLDRNGTITKSLKLVNAFPIDVGGIELDWERNNQIEQFGVTFIYDYYTSSAVNA